MHPAMDVLSVVNASALSVRPETSCTEHSIADHLPGWGTSAFYGG